MRALFELKDVMGTAPLKLHFGPSAAAGREGRWIKTTPGRSPAVPLGARFEGELAASANRLGGQAQVEVSF